MEINKIPRCNFIFLGNMVRIIFLRRHLLGKKISNSPPMSLFELGRLVEKIEREITNFSQPQSLMMKWQKYPSLRLLWATRLPALHRDDKRSLLYLIHGRLFNGPNRTSLYSTALSRSLSALMPWLAAKLQASSLKLSLTSSLSLPEGPLRSPTLSAPLSMYPSAGPGGALQLLLQTAAMASEPRSLKVGLRGQESCEPQLETRGRSPVKWKWFLGGKGRSKPRFWWMRTSTRSGVLSLITSALLISSPISSAGSLAVAQLPFSHIPLIGWDFKVPSLQVYSTENFTLFTLMLDSIFSLSVRVIVWRSFTYLPIQLELMHFITRFSGRIPCPHPGRIWLEQRGQQRALYWHIEARVVLDLQEFPKSVSIFTLHYLFAIAVTATRDFRVA